MKTTIYIHRPSHGLLGCPQPRGYHQFLPWPGAVLCYEFFTRKIVCIFLFQGLASQVDKFVEEEVEVRQIPHLSNGDLRSLGFVTISSRQRLRSAAAVWVPQVICLCSFDCHVLKKVFYKYNDMLLCILERKMIWMWCQKIPTHVSQIGRQSRPPRGAGGDRCWTNSRVEQGRRRGRGLVNWFDV